jgi:hypothetical protein
MKSIQVFFFFSFLLLFDHTDIEIDFTEAVCQEII